MKKIYDLIILFGDFYLKISSLLSSKNKRIDIGRKKSYEYLEKKIIEEEKIIMFHVSSVGEFEQAKPIISRIKEKKEFKILVTYFSSSAENFVSKFESVDYHLYLPSDTENNMRKILNKIKPRILILIKYEFWHNLISLASRKSIPIISVSSTFRKNQIFFKFYGFFFKNILRNISLFLVQDKNSKLLLNSIGINNVKIVGDTRYDRVYKLFKESKDLPLIEGFINNKPSILIGSSWMSDIKILSKEISRDLTESKYIIAPHNINEKEIKFIENKFLNDTIRYSDLPQKTVKKRILIIDNYGMLSSLYKYADLAFIGGGFRGALHNTLEAVVWDIPVIYGFNRNNIKFKEIHHIENSKIGFPIKSGNEFKLLSNRIIKYKDLGKGGNKLVKEKSGATDKIIYYINELL